MRKTIVGRKQIVFIRRLTTQNIPVKISNMKRTGYRRLDIERNLRVPRDGPHRLLYDTWQPLALLLIVACLTVAIFTTEPGAANDTIFYCNADGRIKIRGDRTYKPLWDTEQFFTVNVAYGSMSFSVAKFIDACWDIIIGRGGQMLVAIMAYRTLRRSLTLIMETYDVPLPMATAIYCGQIQLTSVWEVVCCTLRPGKKHLHAGMQSRVKLRLMAQLFACAYVLSFPTLASITTGYRAGLTGYFDFKDGESSQLKPVTKLTNPLISLYDSDRVGLPDKITHLSKPPMMSGKADLGAYLNISNSMNDPTGVLFDCEW